MKTTINEVSGEAAMTRPSVIEAARASLALNIYPVPIKSGTKKPPMKGWPNLRLTIDELQEHFNNGSNLGWLLGIKTRPIADVDLDCPEALAIAPLIVGPKTERISGHASNPSSHYFFELPEEFGTTKFPDPFRKKKEERKMIVELRGKGCQTIVPPSIHADTGNPYRWEKSGDFGKTNHAELLRWTSKIAAAALLVRYWQARVSARLALIGMLAREEWPEEETVEFVSAVVRIADPDDLKEVKRNVANCYHRVEGEGKAFGQPTLKEVLGDNGKTIVKTIVEWLGLKRHDQQGLTALVVTSGRQPITETSNAERLYAKYKHNLRYSSDRRVWCTWSSTHWLVDDHAGVLRRMADVCREIYVEAARERNPFLRGALADWAIVSESERVQRNSVAIARYLDPEVEVKKFSDVFDTHPLLLNVANGTVDLRSGELRPHNREDYLTKTLPISYDPCAQLPKFWKFLDETFADNPALKGYLARCAGYMLTGLTSEQCFWIFYGPTASGKSTFVNILRGLSAGYGLALPQNFFLIDKGSSDFMTANLSGIRLATCVETSEGRRLDVARLKNMTGEDKISAALKYQNYFEFLPQCKLVLATNHRPRVTATDDSIWRRVKLVPFNITVPEDRRVPELAKKLLEEEARGILAWAVLGCRAWLAEGLQEPRVIADAVKEYRSAEDLTEAFISDCFDCDSDAKELRSAVYKRHSDWCKEQGFHPLSRRKLALELQRVGIRGDDGNRFWLGISERSSLGGLAENMRS